MAKELSASHMKYWRKGKTLFDMDGTEYAILDILEQMGVWFATLHNVKTDKLVFVDWDCQDYGGDGGPEMLPYFSKNPKRRRK